LLKSLTKILSGVDTTKSYLTHLSQSLFLPHTNKKNFRSWASFVLQPRKKKSHKHSWLCERMSSRDQC